MAVKEDEKLILISREKISANQIEIFIGRGDSYVFEIVQNGVQPLLALKILNRDGTDVTTITSAVFTMRKHKGGAVKINSQSCVISGTGPNITYKFTTSQTDEAGRFKGRITLTHNTSGSPVEPIPEIIEINIRRAI